MVDLVITCPYCRRLNEIVAEGVEGWERVSCSHCHEEIGRLDDLKNATSEDAKQAGTAFSRR